MANARSKVQLTKKKVQKKTNRVVVQSTAPLTKKKVQKQTKNAVA